MANLSGIPIADRNSEFDSGAAFLLLQKGKISKVVQPSSDWEVEVRAGSPYVVARGKGATKLTAFDLAYEHIQMDFDLLSVNEGIDDLSIRSDIEQFLVWWRSESTQVLRVVEIYRDNFRISGSITTCLARLYPSGRIAK